MATSDHIDLTGSDSESEHPTIRIDNDEPVLSDDDTKPPATKKRRLKRSNATVSSGAPQSRRWMFTINNPIPEDHDDCLSWNAKYLVFQLEKGENGTLHYQGSMFSSPADICYQIIHDSVDESSQ